MNSHHIYSIQRHHRHHGPFLRCLAAVEGTLATYGGGHAGGRRSVGVTGLQFMALCERK